ncbi:MAG TPA: flap endonuclease-1 [Methanoregulaceae archaeon]|nr:flap endonuclease-1 [Methanoregulaceae archaeon]
MGVALRDVLAEYKVPVAWETLRGTAAVDAHNALYQFLSIIRQPDGTPLMDREGRVTSHLSGILFRNVNFLEKGIKPVYVFDGPPPAFKSKTIEERRSARAEAGARWEEALAAGDIGEAYKQARSSSKIDRFIIDTSKQLLALMGIPCIEAPSEGEAQATRLVINGDAAYVVSQDYDNLLFGAPTLIRNLTVSGKRKMHGRTVTLNPERVSLTEVLKGLTITRKDLIEIAILVGTDFNTGVKGVGAKTALKIVRDGLFDKTLEEKVPDFDPGPVIDFFQTPPVTDTYTMEWRPPDTEKIEDMLCGEYGFSTDRVRKALEGVAGKAGQKTLDRWF